MKPTFVILAAVALAGCAPPKPKPHVDAPAGHWVPLFNGKDLNGWTVKLAGENVGENYRDTFRVENGILEVRYDKYDKFGDRFGALYYNTRQSHYWLRVEYRFVGNLAPGAPSWAFKNSGIQLHSQAPQTMRKEQQFPVCVEFDLVGGKANGRQPTGDVCHNGSNLQIDGQPLKAQCSKLSDVTIRDDQWVTALVEVDGAKDVRQVVNGDLIVQYSHLTLDPTNADARALIALGAGQDLSSGYISLQSNGAPLDFRRVEILALDTPQAAAQ
jgi:hypothetical protein